MADGALPDPLSPNRLLALTAQIVSAHVGGNKLGAAELPRLIQTVRDTLAVLGQAPAEVEPDRPEPAVPVRRSVGSDAIVCLVCGSSFKALKRHLAADHGLTPEAYRARWDLPAEYPMVAPDYAATRSRLAKEAGLGRKHAPEPGTDTPAGVAAAPEPARDEVQAEEPATKRRGRRPAGTVSSEG